MKPRTTLSIALATTLLAFMTFGTRATGHPHEPIAPDPEEGFRTLVAAERAFSALSVEKGMRAAFLHHLADDALIFRPGPVNGRQFMSGRPDAAGTLIWEPAFAEVAAAGDLGLSTGPFEFRPAPERKLPTAHGHFVSIWKRTPHSPWQVALDIGINHPRPERGLGQVEVARGPVHKMPEPAPKRGGLSVGVGVLTGSGLGLGIGTGATPRGYADDHAHDVHTLLSAERTYGWTLRAKGTERAYAAVAAEDVRLYREGAAPVIGLDAAVRALADRQGRMEWITQGHGVAVAGDLGYTYGRLEIRPTPQAKADSSAFLHVWRRDAKGKWKLALALENPMPKAGE
jgi:ketosteroid isomerase-like protein